MLGRMKADGCLGAEVAEAETAVDEFHAVGFRRRQGA
ncbi:MAG: hypothetical protein H6R19_274 [Proteobacteria bacterium]|nr:hypothetical protein [Pseudomonadota bacterium]